MPKIKLLAITFDKKQPSTDILFLLDESGSINAPDFAKMKTAVEEAIRLSQAPNARFGIIAFGSNAEIVCSPTEDQNKCIKALNDYKKRGGTTATHEALSLANSLFVRLNVFRRLYLLTDGAPNKPDATISESRFLIDKKGVDLVSIGIGSDINEGFLKTTSSPDRAFLVKDFTALKELFADKFNPKLVIHPFNVRLEAWTDRTVSFGEDMILFVKLVNQGSEDIPAGTRVFFPANNYFESCNILFNEPVFVNESTEDKKALFISKGERRAELIPNQLEFQISNDKCTGLIFDQNALLLKSEIFVRDIRRIEFPLTEIDFLNVLCFGVAGAGKSSFINSVLTCLSQEVTKPVAVGASAGHVTKCLTRFKVDQLEGFEDLRINFFDIWGTDKDNYQNDLFLKVLKGKLEEGAQMETMERDVNSATVCSLQPHETRMHCVLFFMPFTILDSPQVAKSCIEYLRVCIQDYKMNPLIIVTRASLAGDEQRKAAISEKLAVQFGIPERNFFMIDNYTKETEKNIQIDKITLTILQRIVSVGVAYHQFNKGSLIQDKNPTAFSPKCKHCPYDGLRPNFVRCPKCKAVIK